MPPRHTYWTIILEGKPTAFRAHTQDELLPTLRQLQSRHPDAVLMWFARGRLWKSEEESRAALVQQAAVRGDGAGPRGVRADRTKIRARDSRSRGTRSAVASANVCPRRQAWDREVPRLATARPERPDPKRPGHACRRGRGRESARRGVMATGSEREPADRTGRAKDARPAFGHEPWLETGTVPSRAERRRRQGSSAGRTKPAAGTGDGYRRSRLETKPARKGERTGAGDRAWKPNRPQGQEQGRRSRLEAKPATEPSRSATAASGGQAARRRTPDPRRWRGG